VQGPARRARIVGRMMFDVEDTGRDVLRERADHRRSVHRAEVDLSLRSLCRVVLSPCLVKHRQIIDLQEIGEAVGSQTDVDRLPAPGAPLLRLGQRVEFDQAVRTSRVREGARLVGHRPSAYAYVEWPPVEERWSISGTEKVAQRGAGGHGEATATG
jgi:hypothetical protein